LRMSDMRTHAVLELIGKESRDMLNDAMSTRVASILSDTLNF
jgi:hypothetical protein